MQFLAEKRNFKKVNWVNWPIIDNLYALRQLKKFSNPSFVENQFLFFFLVDLLLEPIQQEVEVKQVLQKLYFTYQNSSES